MSSDFMDAQTGVELTHLFSHPFADNLIMNAASLVFLKIRKEFKVISFTLLISIFAKYFLNIIIYILFPHKTQMLSINHFPYVHIYILAVLCVCAYACADVFLIIIDESDDRLYIGE
jgi:hypothetical protein